MLYVYLLNKVYSSLDLMKTWGQNEIVFKVSFLLKYKANQNQIGEFFPYLTN